MGTAEKAARLGSAQRLHFDVLSSTRRISAGGADSTTPTFDTRQVAFFSRDGCGTSASSATRFKVVATNSMEVFPAHKIREAREVWERASVWRNAGAPVLPAANSRHQY